MTALLLIVGLVAVFRIGTARTFLTVVLPAIMFLPGDFFNRLPHLPPLCFQDTALCALGFGMILKDLRRWRFSRMDLWVFTFVATAAYADRIPYGINGAWLRFGTGAIDCFIPYMAGKLLMEQPGMRLKSVKDLVRFMIIASIFSLPQAVIKVNPYIHLWSHFFPGQWPENAQTRMGFGRVAGPWGAAESAGMVLIVGILLALWLQHGKQLLPLKYANASIILLALTLLMTQSRGPWLGSLIALAIASIGRAAKPGRRAAIIVSLALVVGVPLYSAFENYTSGKRAAYGSVQETAQYRKELIANFVPIAEAGGAWGWGNSFPHPDGQTSLDNEYLLIWLLQGYVGLTALVLILVETAARCVRLGILAQSIRERYLVLTLLGVLSGLAFALATVWLTDQMYLLFFLLVGWTQSIRPRATGGQESQDGSVTQEMKLQDSLLVYT